ncbi:MAG: DUF1566 domain-containing protein, partial [Crocinitomicaceae bacterium]|nr:DUF1566 domain-containing protein [Crocinitomicaceae bacterium]
VFLGAYGIDLVNDADANPANELNTGVVLNGTDLEITDAGGTIVTDLSSLQDGVNDNDADPSNEIQALSFSNDTLYLSNGGQVFLGSYGIDLVDDADADPTNEIQTISRTGTTVTLSNGGGTFTDSVNTYSAGTGIDITNNVISTSGTCGLSIGDTYQGGIIFYLDASGCHGLISAPVDQSAAAIEWFNGSYTQTNAVRDGIGAGEFNTERIIANQGPGNYAAQICANYQGGSYGDWYLPSKYELNLMYQNIGQGNALGLGNIGGFAFSYWSSNDVNIYDAWVQNFGNGGQFNLNKSYNYYVRAVRAF